MNAELEVKTDALLGEGPVWDYKSNVLYWVDITGKSINIYDPEKKENFKMDTDKMPCLVYRNKDEVFAVLQDGIYSFCDNELNFISRLYDYDPNIRFNDGSLDKSGTLWIGTMGLGELRDEIIDVGSLYIYKDEKFIKKLSDVTISNGIAFDYELGKMYFIDTYKENVVSFDYDAETSSIENKKEVVSLKDVQGMPDGMTIDDEGNLYIALWGGGGVYIFSPKENRKIGFINVDASRVTSVEFGGKDKQTLFITTAKSENEENSGSLFKIDKCNILFK